MEGEMSEAKEAAERLRLYYSTEIRWSPLLVLADCETLAKAYLADHEGKEIPESARRLISSFRTILTMKHITPPMDDGVQDRMANDCKDWLTEHGDAEEPNEALAATYRAESRTTEDGKPEGTPESLQRCASMLNTYAADCFPANSKGQIHFARAMMESTADEITAYLASLNVKVAS